MIYLVAFVMLTTLDNRHVWINPSQIVSISETREHKILLTEKVHCALILSNSKLITVADDCDTVMKKFKDEH